MRNLTKNIRIIWLILIVLILGLMIFFIVNNRAADEQIVQVPEETQEQNTPEETALPEAEESLEEEAVQEPIGEFASFEIVEGDEIYNRIYGKSYQDNPNIGIESLRYLTIPHYDFDHNVQTGEMIVNVAIAEDVLEIFKTLYENEYEINSIRLIDDFWAGDGISSDDASIAANNTSAFCYRQIAGGSGLSNHAYGMAIDINPYQNPYYYIVNGEPTDLFEWDWDYLDRDSGKDHMILQGDICQTTFAAYGFTWGGDWANPVDYQHFERTW